MIIEKLGMDKERSNENSTIQSGIMDERARR